MFAAMLAVCSFLFSCRTRFGAQVNLVSGTEPFRAEQREHVLAVAYIFSQGQELLQGCSGQADPSLHLASEHQPTWVSSDLPLSPLTLYGFRH